MRRRVAGRTLHPVAPPGIEAAHLLRDNVAMHPLRPGLRLGLPLCALLLLTSGCAGDKGSAVEPRSAEPAEQPAQGEPAPGEFPQQGPGDGPDRPVNAGPNASESCLRPARAAGPVVTVTGAIAAPAKFARGPEGRFLVLAVDQRLDTLEPNRVLEVYGVVAVEEDRFELQFAAPEGAFWLCAVGPAQLGGIEYFSHMGCSSRPLRGRELAAGSAPPQQIEVRRGLQHLGLIGLSQFDTRVRDGERVRRTVSGQIEAGEAAPSGYFIAAAAADVLAGSDVAEDPRVVGAVASGQEFKLTYLAEPGEPLWICVIALPPLGKTAYEVDSLAGAGCERVQFPSGSEPMELNGVRHRLDTGKPVPLTPHEREHYTMLQRCFLD